MLHFHVDEEKVRVFGLCCGRFQILFIAQISKFICYSNFKYFQVRGVISCLAVITEPIVHTDSPPEPSDTQYTFDGLPSLQTESLYFSVSENAPRAFAKPGFSSLLHQSQADLAWSKKPASATAATSQRLSRQITLEAATSKLVQVRFHICEILLELTSDGECRLSLDLPH